MKIAVLILVYTQAAIMQRHYQDYLMNKMTFLDMTEEEKQKNPMIKLAGKSIVLFFLVIFIMSSVSLLWETYTEDVAWDSDEARRVSRCETYLKEKQYGKLWEYLELYDLEGKRYEVYWEAVDQRLEEIQEEQNIKMQR